MPNSLNCFKIRSLHFINSDFIYRYSGALPMPPGSDFPGQRKHGLGTQGSSAPKSTPGRTGKSKLLDQLPMPPSSSSPGVDEDSQDGINSRHDRAARIKRKPSVIGKIAASARISEDGSEWGER